MNIPSDLQSEAAYYSYLGVKNPEQTFLEKHSFFRYTEASIPKRRGGARTLLIPERRLKFLQRKTLVLLEQLYSARVPVHGFVKTRGAISNANRHQKRPYLLNLDLANYFGSIFRARVVGMLRAIGLDAATASAVATICVTKDQLPQGAPTSPILANMVSFSLDSALLRFAKDHHLRYTRYADDISFSSHSKPLSLFEGELPNAGKVPLDKLSRGILAAIQSNSFQINSDKIWFSDPKSRKEVTGLIVNDFTNVKRRFVRDLRASLYKVETMGCVAAEKDYQARYLTNNSLEKVLRGRLTWLAQVRGRSFSAYRTLAARFNKQFPAVSIPIDPTYDEIVERAVWIVDFWLPNDEYHQGTAFFIKDIGLVTADHVLWELPSEQEANLYRPADAAKKYKVKPSTCRCKNRDLVVLEHDVPVSEHLSLPAATSPTRAQDDVVALGYPDYGPGDPLHKVKGTVVAQPTKSGVKMVQVSSVLTKGISGGPIINDLNQVVGIAKSGGYDEKRQLAVDISELMALIAGPSPH